MVAVLLQTPFDGVQQMVGQQRDEDVRVHPFGALMEHRAYPQGALQVPKRLGVGLELRDSEGLMGFAEAAGGWR